MLTETFDKDTEQMISPEAVYGVREKVCDICIVTFSDVVVEEIRKNFDCTTVAEIGSVNGGRPIYLLEYKGKKIAFYMTMISSAAAGACPGRSPMPYRSRQLYYVRLLRSTES